MRRSALMGITCMGAMLATHAQKVSGTTFPFVAN